MSEQEVSSSIAPQETEATKQQEEFVKKSAGYFLRENHHKKVIQIYYKIIKILDRVSFERRRNILRMIDDIGIKFFTAPASSRLDFHSCFPGGLARHSLYTIKNMLKLIDAFKIIDYSKESVILVSLFHDIGKIGDIEEDYYIPQDDSYWKRRGYLYKINERLSKTPVNIISLYLLQHYNIPISMGEYQAIYSLTERKDTFREEYNLTALLQWADKWSIMEEKREIVDAVEPEKHNAVNNREDIENIDLSLEEGKINPEELFLEQQETI
jgi:hypothetical protein